MFKLCSNLNIIVCLALTHIASAHFLWKQEVHSSAKKSAVALTLAENPSPKKSQSRSPTLLKDSANGASLQKVEHPPPYFVTSPVSLTSRDPPRKFLGAMNSG